MISVPAVLLRQRWPGSARIRLTIRTVAAALTRRLRIIRGEHLLWLVFAAALLLYAWALVVEPSAAGKGGR